MPGVPLGRRFETSHVEVASDRGPERRGDDDGVGAHERRDEVAAHDGGEEGEARRLRREDGLGRAAGEDEELDGDGDLAVDGDLADGRVLRAHEVVDGRDALAVDEEEDGGPRLGEAHAEGGEEEGAHRRRLGEGRRRRVVVRDGSDRRVVEERQEDDVEGLELRVPPEDEGAEDDDDLDRGGDAVEDVGADAAEDEARLVDRRVDRLGAGRGRFQSTLRVPRARAPEKKTSTLRDRSER